MKLKKFLSTFICSIFIFTATILFSASFNAIGSSEEQPKFEIINKKDTSTQTEFNIYSQPQLVDYTLYVTRCIFNKFGIDIKIVEDIKKSSYGSCEPEHDSFDSSSSSESNNLSYKPKYSNQSTNTSSDLLKDENYNFKQKLNSFCNVNDKALQTEDPLYTESDLEQYALKITQEVFNYLDESINTIINEELYESSTNESSFY